MYRLLILLSSVLLSVSLQAQDLTQTISGVVREEITGVPIAGANITLNGSLNFSTISDESGVFKINASVGRYKLQVSYIGYKAFIKELQLSAGKEQSITILLSPNQTQLETIEITGSGGSNEENGAISLPIEKTLRIPANFFDPVRVVTSYPAVQTANDQNNSIIIKGNSPNGLLWRLNGLDIVNPNHLSNAGTLSDRPAANGGGVNILSAQMLDQTNFYTGYFPASYGNGLSGAIDMNLRTGNKSKHEYTAQASLIGIDLAAEGPIQKDKSSFLANYRYSTVGLLSGLGLDFGDEKISFQDFSFNTNASLSEKSSLTFFGVWGESKNRFNKKPKEEWQEEKDRSDINFSGMTYATGLIFDQYNNKGKFSAGVALSSSDQERMAIVPKPDNGFIGIYNDQYESQNTILSTNVNYDWKVAGTTALKVGLMTNFYDHKLYYNVQAVCLNCTSLSKERMEGSSEGILFQPYFSLMSSVTEKFSIELGSRFLYYSFNETKSIEPRLQLQFQPTQKGNLSFSYSLISQLQQPVIYFSPGNKNLDFTKSHHLDLGYKQFITSDFSLTTGLFYQHLFNVPVEKGFPSTFSTLNFQDITYIPTLINDGTGDNYGITATAEKSFFQNYYLLIGGSYYNSTFTGSDNVSRDTRFNGKYTINTVYGKEWVKESKNRTIGINTRLLYLGGLRQIPVDLEASRLEGRTIYDGEGVYSEKLNDYYRIDFRISFRKNKPGYTRTFAIDIQNLLGHENDAYRYYDVVRDQLVTKKQLGIIPVLVYRIDF